MLLLLKFGELNRFLEMSSEDHSARVRFAYLVGVRFLKVSYVRSTYNLGLVHAPDMRDLQFRAYEAPVFVASVFRCFGCVYCGLFSNDDDDDTSCCACNHLGFNFPRLRTPIPAPRLRLPLTPALQ